MRSDYYESNAEGYARRTLDADMGAQQARFLAHIPQGGRILDVGCGAGRDLAAFREGGYAAEGIEPAEALAAIARRHSGAPVRVLPVQALTDEGRYHGIWACASLLHLRRAELPKALARLGRALQPGGVLWVSLKDGRGQHVERGQAGGWRLTTLYAPDELRRIIASIDTLQLLTLEHEIEERQTGPVRWLVMLARRPARR